jgi:hypothetical protein
MTDLPNLIRGNMILELKEERDDGEHADEAGHVGETLKDLTGGVNVVLGNVSLFQYEVF